MSSKQLRKISPGQLVALMIILACSGLLLYLHWSDLFPGAAREQADAEAPKDPVERCIAEERATIERMVEETPELESRRELFIQRAEARCEARVGSGNSAPPAQGSGQLPE